MKAETTVQALAYGELDRRGPRKPRLATGLGPPGPYLTGLRERQMRCLNLSDSLSAM